MRLKELDQYFFKQKEPHRGCLLALRQLILAFDENLEEAWKYKTPCFDYKGKMCCYLWIDKKTKWPYLGIVKGCHISHPALYGEGLKQIKKYFVNPEQDISKDTIHTILGLMIQFYN